MGAAVISALLVLPSCIDELNPPCNNISGEHETFLTIYLPNVESAARHGETRADGNQITNALADAEEAAINTLWFFAYPVTESGTEDTNRQVIVVALDPENPTEPGTTVFNYSRYDVGGFEAGGYHIYVLANMEDYTAIDADDVTADFPEEDLRNLVLNFNTTKYLEYGNLPMACLNTEMQYGVQGAPTNKVGDNGIFNVSKNQNEVFADLTFLCAKVRYTILYDHTDFSSQFSSNSDIDITGAKAYKVREEFALTGEGTASNDFIDQDDNGFSGFLRNHTKTEYPGIGSSFLKEDRSEEGFVADLEAASAHESADKRAWQGTIYLPANDLNGETSTTHLKFTATGKGISSEGYKFSSISKDGKLNKGEFYDLVARLTNPDNVDLTTNLTVSPWTTQTLSYALHGPYELIVQETELEVNSGKWVTLGFSTDASTYSFISPKFPDENGKDLFTIEEIESFTLDELGQPYAFDDDFQHHIRISLSNNILYNELKGKDLTNYKYFHIKAGNLYKKIKLDPVNVNPDMQVYPELITINVNEYRSSGKNSDTFDITIVSNISTSDGKITLTDVSGTVKGLGSGSLQITDGDSPMLPSSPGNSPYTLKDNNGVLNLKITNLTTGNSYWNKSYEYVLTFTLSPTGESPITRTVTIKVIPDNVDYIIHFRDKTRTWDNPHIYIYQCLDMPYGLDAAYQDYEGRTVGYMDNGDYLAALEYMFSNNIAFKGWTNYGGTANPQMSGTTYGGGFVLLGGSSNSINFKPVLSKGSTYYNFGVNLNESHMIDINKWTCSTCQSIISNPAVLYSGDRMWPGISMVDEGNGWFKYTLSGVATPGKAMIMFTDDHSNDKGNGYRYPQGLAVGVPLFDYPDHEGWFEYTGSYLDSDQNFVDDEPTDLTPYTVPSGAKITIEWPKTYSGTTIQYAYVFWDGNGNNGWSGKQASTSTTDSKYWSYTLDTSSYSSAVGKDKLTFVFTNAGTNPSVQTYNIPIKFGKFTKTGANTYTYKIEKLEFKAGDVIRVVWGKEYSGRDLTKLNAWSGNDVLVNKIASTLDYNGKHCFDFTIPAGKTYTQIECQVTDDSFYAPKDGGDSNPNSWVIVLSEVGLKGGKYYFECF